MYSGDHRSCPRPDFFTEKWSEASRHRVHALRSVMKYIETEYEQMAENGSTPAKKCLANLDYNRRILPMCIDAIAILEECPELNHIDDVLQRLEQNPTQQLPQQLFTVISKIKKKYYGKPEL